MKTQKTPKPSRQEYNVFKGLKAGKKNKEIAEEMEISQKTVSTYVDRMHRKYKVDKSRNTYFLVNRLSDLFELCGYNDKTILKDGKA